MTDLGPLADPTPSERALSLLRMACDIIGLVWPRTEDTSLAFIIAEDRAILMTRIHRIRHESEKADRCNDVARACYFTSASVLAAKRMDRPVELRYEARAKEHLTWVPQYKGPNHGR